MQWPNAVDEATFFASEAPRLLEHAIDLLPERSFDAVVVDEGQDFMPAWWDTVELINKRPTEGPLYIFFDPDQQIFQATSTSMPDLGAPFMLPVNCRNTEQIASRCGRILGKSIAVNCGAPEGKTPHLVHAPNAEQQAKEVEKQIKEWMAPGNGLKSNQVALVTRGKVQNSSLKGVKILAGNPVTENLNEWRNGAGILLTSLYRFKGLEADALVLADIIRPDPDASPAGFRAQHFYVACSRAKHLLTIVSFSEEWES
jgi:superfamily I DNA/RNA helicase